LIVALASLLLTTAYAADVAISISLGQPGFYGQIDIGDYPPPRLVYAEPVIVEHVVVVEAGWAPCSRRIRTQGKKARRGWQRLSGSRVTRQ